MLRITVSNQVYNEILGELRTKNYHLVDDHRYGDAIELHGVTISPRKVQAQRRQLYEPMTGDE